MLRARGFSVDLRLAELLPLVTASAFSLAFAARRFGLRFCRSSLAAAVALALASAAFAFSAALALAFVAALALALGTGDAGTTFPAVSSMAASCAAFAAARTADATSKRMQRSSWGLRSTAWDFAFGLREGLWEFSCSTSFHTPKTSCPSCPGPHPPPTLPQPAQPPAVHRSCMNLNIRCKLAL